jgi:lipoprotein-releasing system permease protein
VSYEWFIARRYLTAHRRSGILSFISFFTIAGIALGTAALIITLSILSGFEKEIQEKAVGFTSHIQVQGYRNKLLPEYRNALRRMRQEVDGIKTVSPFVSREAMIRLKGEVDGIFLKGIDIATDASIVSHHIVEGTFLAGGNGAGPQLVIGRKLATRLNAAPGDRVVVFGLPGEPGSSLQPRAMAFTLAGFYETGMAEYDDIYAYASMGDVQKLLQIGDAITGYDIVVADLTSVDDVAGRIQELLGYPHFTRTVFQQYRNLFSWVELQKKLSPILLTLIMIVATMNMIGTILMVVLDKAAAIGILRTLGSARSAIGRIFLLQGMVMAGAGVVLGNVVAFFLLILQLQYRIISIPSDIYYMSSIPVLLKPGNFIYVSLLTILLCLLTSIIPSRAAARVDAIQTLRFG